MVEMTIDSIRVSITNYQRVIILREKDAERLLPIWIGPAEADSIAVKLQDVSVPRPLTHDLLENVIFHLCCVKNIFIICWFFLGFGFQNLTFEPRLISHTSSMS